MTREEAIMEIRNWDFLNKNELEAIRVLVPELRESEDERIRKEIVGVIQKHYPNTPESYRWISWLEKQKYDRMKPVYDNQDSFESALEKAWNDYHNGHENVDKLEDDYVECAHAKGFREGYLFGIENQKEQKPSWIEEDDQLIGFIFDLLNDLVWRKDWAMSKEECLERLKSLRPQPKQEWSEEDKNMWTHLNGYLNGFSCSEYAIKQMADWFYELPNRFNLQPKQEWSEEDENMVNDIIHNLEDLKKTFSSNGDREYAEETQKQIDWLKSHYAWRTFIDRAIKWLDDKFYFQNYSSGRGEDYEITTNEFDSMDEMFDSFRKTVFLRSAQK